MKRYYYGEGEEIHGPKPLNELQELARSRRLSWSVMVSESRSGPWMALERVGALGTKPPKN